ncbi:MAG: hypothetical protein EOP67_01055 [Sphingomonas sp.]|jgi:hypothetical protein|nr:MAG: hypothetical protein EOP67_01055 [Sphingomonas sp.]
MSSGHDLYPSFNADADEREYLLRRAEHHRQLAEKSQQPASRSIHRRFQQLYEQRAAWIGVVLSH